MTHLDPIEYDIPKDPGKITLPKPQEPNIMYSILVADDERWIRKGIIKMIDAKKLEINEIYEADSITAALRQFELHKPDIILSDVIFPTENGCDFCEQVFSIKPETRIVMISAFDNFEFARRSIKYQAVDYLLKPVSKEQLNQVIHQCIEQIKNRQMKEKYIISQFSKTKVPNPQKQNKNPDEAEKTSEEQIENIIKRMKSNMTEKYTLSELAAECCLSEVYFSSLFKKVSGMSPMNYLIHIRIEKACELICSTNWRMVKIAKHVGYADYQYFTKVFKKETGKTPGEYKETIRKEFEDD